MQWFANLQQLFLWSNEKKFEILLGNLEYWDLQTKEEKNYYSLLGFIIRAQFNSLHLWWYGGKLVPMELNWQLAHLERHHQCWKVRTGFRPTYAPIQKTRPCIFQQDNAKLHIASVTVTTAWPHSIKVLIAHAGHQLKTFGASWNAKYDKTGPRTVEQLQYQTRMGQHSSSNWNSQMFTNCG